MNNNEEALRQLTIDIQLTKNKEDKKELQKLRNNLLKKTINT